ncbi:DNA-binding protein, partial [Candidatus Woesearchaeota archaeon]|nr:DNA-binding protein [Candidatus Woesearchaeota archaeon]
MMIFIVDTNIVFSGLLKEGDTRDLLIDSPFTLYAPETMIKEIRKHEELILEKSGLTKDEFEILFDLLVENIVIVEKEQYNKHITEADRIIGNIDKGDVPFIALALSIQNKGIWSDDRDFEKQDKVKVWKT